MVIMAATIALFDAFERIAPDNPLAASHMNQIVLMAAEWKWRGDNLCDRFENVECHLNDCLNNIKIIIILSSDRSPAIIQFFFKFNNAIYVATVPS